MSGSRRPRRRRSPARAKGVLIIPGVGDNRTTAQLINLTELLARAGLVAMTMGTPTLFSYILSPGDSDAVVQAFRRCCTGPESVPIAGILGFSAGDSLACLAAADPRIAGTPRVSDVLRRLLNARDLLGDVGHRALVENGQPQSWKPDPVPLEVLANTLAGTLSSSEGAEISAAFSFSNAVPLIRQPDRATLAAGRRGVSPAGGRSAEPGRRRIWTRSPRRCDNCSSSSRPARW